MQNDMRTDEQINAEIKALKAALKLKDRWNSDTREQIEAQLEVLEKRMTSRQVELRWYEDETTEDYREGDNELWSEADRAADWLAGKNTEAPSNGLT